MRGEQLELQQQHSSHSFQQPQRASNARPCRTAALLPLLQLAEAEALTAPSQQHNTQRVTVTVTSITPSLHLMPPSPRRLLSPSRALPRRCSAAAFHSFPFRVVSQLSFVLLHSLVGMTSAPPEAAETVQSIAAARIPLSALQRNNYQQLVDAIGPSRLVLLGEATHGTEESATSSGSSTHAHTRTQPACRS